MKGVIAPPNNSNTAGYARFPDQVHCKHQNENQIAFQHKRCFRRHYRLNIIGRLLDNTPGYLALTATDRDAIQLERIQK
jgi:hypothetical protein